MPGHLISLESNLPAFVAGNRWQSIGGRKNLEVGFPYHKEDQQDPLNLGVVKGLTDIP